MSRQYEITDLGSLVRAAEDSCPEEWGVYGLAVQLPDGTRRWVVGATFDPDETGRATLRLGDLVEDGKP